DAKEVQFRIQPELRFQDGTVPNAGEVLRGVRPGDVRVLEGHIGSASMNPGLRGQRVTLTITVHDLKYLRLPEPDEKFVREIGFDSLGDLRDGLKTALSNRFGFLQRQAMRKSITDTLIERAPFELPAALVARQEAATIRKLVEELKRGGFTDYD